MQVGFVRRSEHKKEIMFCMNEGAKILFLKSRVGSWNYFFLMAGWIETLKMKKFKTKSLEIDNIKETKNSVELGLYINYSQLKLKYLSSGSAFKNL